ncbi:hypothetical protein V6N13_147226 [Hibiscus sabdariffa]
MCVHFEILMNYCWLIGYGRSLGKFYVVWLLPDLALAKHARHYKFNVKMQNVTRLCQTKSIVAINGQFPGPRLLIKVVNHVQYNVTLQWGVVESIHRNNHPLLQLLSKRYYIT